MLKRHVSVLDSLSALYHCLSVVTTGVGWAVSGYIDRGTPFFLSYARAGGGLPAGWADDDPDQLVERLFASLSRDVAERLGLPVGTDAGYMDRSMRPGTLWTDELLQAVGSCQVLVALLSPRYLTSEWCAMEWHAFAQRSRRISGPRAPRHLRCIIPVVWLPLFDGQVPQPVKDAQWFEPAAWPDPAAPREYRDGGVFGLMRTQQEPLYRIAVWQLSKEIVQTYRSHNLVHRKFKREQLHNIFQERAS